MRTYFTNARIVTDKSIERGTLCAENGTIAAILPDGYPHDGAVVDVRGGFILPGFIDIHVHGGGDADFTDGTVQAFETAADMHLRHGTTTIFPTTMSCPPAELSDVFSAYRAFLRHKKTAANVGGLHLEGPFLSPAMAGAQRPGCIVRPDAAAVKMLKANSDSIARVTCAPEEEGVPAMAKALFKAGVQISMGHTNATYEQAEAALTCGFTSVTHLYSATSGFHKVGQKVHIGVTQAGLALDGLYTELIGDGCHVPPPLLRLVVKIKGADKVCLVTDAMRAAGTDATESYLGRKVAENRVIIEDGVAKLPDRSFFAGSIGTMDRALRFAVLRAGLSLPDAARLVSLNPARLMRIDRHTGSIAAGKDADLVVTDADLTVKQVYVKGRLVADE